MATAEPVPDRNIAVRFEGVSVVRDGVSLLEGITATVDFAACGFTLCAQATGAIDAIEPG